MTTFQAPILNESPSIAVAGVEESEMERRRLALQHALASCLSADEMARTVRLCEQEFAKKMSVSVSELCQRLFETMPQIQLDKDARLRLLRAMRQPVKPMFDDDVLPTLKPAAPLEFSEPIEFSEPAESSTPLAPSEPIQLPSPEDSTSPELLLAPETPPTVPSPEDSASPELFVWRYTNFGKEIIG